MGVFRSFGAMLIRPYTRMASDVASSGKNIGQSLKKIQELSRRKKEQNEGVEATNGAEAFDKLFKANGWTLEELGHQLMAVNRIKWMSLILFVLFTISFLCVGFLVDGLFAAMVGCALSMLAAFFFGVRVIQFSIFQVQLREKYLITYDEFVSRKDFWKLLLS